ncbi:hypothetical protein GCM10020367_21320 [Streptomyces sannanensis]|uniref:Uncharacterized protein n=1 Tax=Streptomyces sannanensis TaxID=285536 RepID=A0ABP6SAB7_9ACTN
MVDIEAVLAAARAAEEAGRTLAVEGAVRDVVCVLALLPASDVIEPRPTAILSAA